MNAEVVAEIQEIRERVQYVLGFFPPLSPLCLGVSLVGGYMLTCDFRQETQYKSTSWLQLVSRRNFVRVHVGIAAHIWAQYSGTNALMYYIVYIFQMAGLSGTKNLTIASIQYIINVVMTVPALLFVDKLPRRHVMMAGSLLMAIWLFSTGGIMASKGHAVPGGLEGSPTITWVVEGSAPSKAIIALSYLFIATFACTWG